MALSIEIWMFKCNVKEKIPEIINQSLVVADGASCVSQWFLTSSNRAKTWSSQFNPWSLPFKRSGVNIKTRNEAIGYQNEKQVSKLSKVSKNLTSHCWGNFENQFLFCSWDSPTLNPSMSMRIIFTLFHISMV